MFDSNLLKDTLNSYIAEGKRNFAIDLSPLDYIYSDAINVILALNRRILDVSGRLSLLSPNPEVRSILERTGLHNILKIYETETDLLRSSEDIILQTTRFNLSELKSYQQPSPPPPKSEFDEFKSEISTAMSPGQPADNAGPYGALDTEIPDDSFVKQAPRYEESFAPPPRQPAQQFQAQEQDFGPVSPPRRKQPKQAPQPAFEMAPETPSPQRHEREPAPELPEVKTGRKTVDRDFDRFAREDRDEEFEDEKPKRSLTPVLIGIVILVLVGAGIVGYLSFVKKPGKQVTLQTPATPAPAPQTMPELSQPAQPPAAAAPAPAAPAPETAVQPPAAKTATSVERQVEKQPVAKHPRANRANLLERRHPDLKPFPENLPLFQNLPALRLLPMEKSLDPPLINGLTPLRVQSLSLFPSRGTLTPLKLSTMQAEIKPNRRFLLKKQPHRDLSPLFSSRPLNLRRRRPLLPPPNRPRKFRRRRHRPLPRPRPRQVRANPPRFSFLPCRLSPTCTWMGN